MYDDYQDMKTSAVILALLLPAMAWAAEDAMTVRLLTYIAGGERAAETATGYRIVAPSGTVMARKTGYGWRLEPTTGFSGAEIRAHGTGWIVSSGGERIIYRRTTGGFSAEPGQSLRVGRLGRTLEPSGVEALFWRR